MKKILLIHHSGNLGGAGVNVYNIVKTLEKRYEVIVYCPAEPNELSQFLLSKNINVKQYEFNPGYIGYYSGSGSVLSFAFIKGIIKILKNKDKWMEILEKENPDMVLVNSKILSWFSSLLKKRNVKSVCYIGETKPKSIFNIMNKIHTVFLEKFTGVIFISKYDEKVEKLVKPKTIVVPNYIQLNDYINNRKDTDILKDYGIPSGFNILFVGGMQKIKGYEIAVKSLKYIKDEKINLVVAGNNQYIYRKNNNPINIVYNVIKKNYEYSIKRLIKNNNLENKIYKIGLQENLREIYQIADVLIFPATVPHQARPVFEAGAQSVAAIVPDFPHYREYIKDNVNGLIFKNNNAKALAKALDRLIKDDKLKLKLGENNYKYTMENHLKDNSGMILEAFIDEIFKT